MAISVLGTPQPGYQPGTCNIGPAEIAARRRAGHIGTLVTVIAFVLLIVTDAPAPWRLLLFLPAAVAASGYLQAQLHFCANFGLRGVFDFSNRLSDTESVLQQRRGRTTAGRPSGSSAYRCSSVGPSPWPLYSSRSDGAERFPARPIRVARAAWPGWRSGTPIEEALR